MEEVLIFLQFPEGQLDEEKFLDAVFDLEDVLISIINTCNLGIFNGNEFCEDTITFFISGDSANKIYETVFPILSRYLPSLPGSYILKRYCHEGNDEEKFFLP